MSIPASEATTIGFLLLSDFESGRRVVDWAYCTPVSVFQGKSRLCAVVEKQQMLTFPPSAHFFFLSFSKVID